MKHLAWIGAALFAATLFAPVSEARAGSPASGQTTEMQARRQQAGAMTPQRARRECMQSMGYDPGRPGAQSTGRFSHQMVAQISSCVSQKMRGGR